MSESNREPGRAAASPGRYRLNLVILVVFLILLTFWFYRHLHLYVTESILIGGTVTLWGAWKIVQSIFRSWLGKESATWAQQFLGRPGATEYLIFGLVVLGILWATTSSIYLVYEGAGAGQSEIEVEVLAGENPILEPITVTSFRRISGRPFFFRRASHELEFVISKPGGYLPEKRTFAPWSNLYLEVPRDFRKKSFRLLRLVPRRGLIGNLPLPAAEVGSSYFLTVEIRGREQRIEDLRFRTLYLGAGARDLKRLVRAQKRDELRRQLKSLLSVFPAAMGADARESFLDAWEAEPQLIETAELEEGELVIVKVGRKGESRPLVNLEVEVSEETIHNVPLEVLHVADEAEEDAPEETPEDAAAESPE